jgi:O-antigen ligase
MRVSARTGTATDTWLLVGGGLLLGTFVSAAAYLGDAPLAAASILALPAAFVIARRPEVGLLLMLALLMFKPDFAQGRGLVTILALALTAILAVKIAVRKEFQFLRVRQVQLLFLIGVLILMNWLLAGQMQPPSYLSQVDQTAKVMQRTVFQLALVIFFVSFISTARQLLVVTGLFLVGLVATIPGAIFHSVKAVELAAQQVGKVDRLRAVAVAGIDLAENANYLAFISVMGISLTWFAILEYRSRLLRLTAGVVIPVLAFTVVLSGSRSGLLLLMISLPLLLLQSGLRRSHLAAVILLLVVSGSVALAFVPERVLQRISSLALTSESASVSDPVGSLQHRLLMIQLGLKLFSESPFIGVGIGNVRWMTALDPASGGVPMTLHNSYLLMLAEGGIILLAAYLLLFWHTFRDLGKALKLSAAAPEIRLRWLILATRTNLLLLLIFSFFAETWKEFYYLLILATTPVLLRIYQQAAAQWARSRSST